MTDGKRKRSVIYISSSSSGDEEEAEDEEEESEVEEIDDDEDDEEDQESQVEEIDDDGDEDEEFSGDETDCSEEDEEKESGNADADDDEALCKHVISFLREGKDLEVLSLKECKAYLRKHGLRLAGSKDVCRNRIKEHWRIEKGNGELLYPRSSFVINCTGDICKGDVVLFRQKVYKKFDKVTRNGKVLGMRTVAGRVVKESYGSAKQQHTFTVEVLWSKGTKQLSPLFPLLVKGHNLYKLKTFRQRWNNEAERLQVLSEKHRRGTAARAVRALKRSKKNQSANRQHLNEGRKHQKCSHQKRPTQTKWTAELLKGKHAYGHKKNTSLQHKKVNNHHQEVSSSRQLHLKGNVRSDVGYNPNRRHSKSGHMNMEMDPSFHSHAYTRQELPSQFARPDFGYSSTMVSPHLLRPLADYDRYQSNPSSNIGRNNNWNHHNNWNHFPDSIEAEMQFHQYPREQRPRGFQHSHPGRARFGR